MRLGFIILPLPFLLIAAAEPPSTVPIPMTKPALTEKPISTPDVAETNDGDDQEKGKQKKPENDKSDDTKLAQCEAKLKALGAVFEKAEPIDDGPDCKIEDPVKLTAINTNVTLESSATMHCNAALALSQWVQSSVVPNLKVAMPQKELKSISNASAYVCRNRNHSANGKISEHAKGNAFDIASLTFTDGSKMQMKPRDKDGTIEGAFQRTITASACLYFTTVLSPGSDATHQDHLHVDVMARKNDFRYCM